MAAPITLRLDAETRRKIERIAERRRISKSEVIRQALHSWAELHYEPCSPYEGLADLLGIGHGGDPKRSENSGRKFEKILRERRAQS
jgi:Arc/MetJ-type ribon-helix-helix transcriptional regulator